MTELKTGLVKFGEGWPGVFLENSDAIVYAADLRKLLMFHSDAPQTCRAKVEELAKLLERVKHG